MQEAWVWSLSPKGALEKEMTTHSSILAWRIPWTEETGGLQFMGLETVGHDLTAKQQPQSRLSTKESVLSNCGAGKDSWEFLGLQVDQTKQF